MNSRICKMLSIEHPIIQGGMAWVSTAELAAAVSNSGGLGIIAAGNAPAEVISEEIRKIKKLTDKPYGINVMLLSPYADEIIDLVIREKVPVVTTGAGNPGKYIKMLKETNTKIIPVVPSVSLAKRVEKAGVDAIIVEGTEAGGHIGELTTMALVPQVVDAVDIPVIAAGGIADGRGMIAAFALGAEGVQIGTRFICSNECNIHEDYKQSVLSAKDRDTIVTGRSTGHPVRVIKNKFAREFQKIEKSTNDLEELEKLGTGKLRLSVVDGDVDNGSVMAGQIAGLVKDIKSCKEIIEDMVKEASEVYDSISRFIN